jgi:AraC-like DNA-binding protein
LFRVLRTHRAAGVVQTGAASRGRTRTIDGAHTKVAQMAAFLTHRDGRVEAVPNSKLRSNLRDSMLAPDALSSHMPCEAPMAPSPVEIVTSDELPRPEFDAWYQPGLVSDYYEVRHGYHILRRKGTTTYYLIYSVSGVGFVRDARDRTIQLRTGDLALVRARSYQEYGIWPNSNHWTCHWVHFDAQPHWTYWLPLAETVALEGLSVAHIGLRSVQQQLNDLFFSLHSERRRDEVWSTAMALNLLERILILARSSADGRESPIVDSRISRVLQAIEKNAPHALSSAKLSHIAGLSPSRLACVFKQHTGVSILAAVNRVRLRTAQHALQDPGATLHDVAERSGFRSPYSFSNWYLKQTGMRPGEYRRDWTAKVVRARAKRDSSE